jgi:guanine deaminase
VPDGCYVLPGLVDLHVHAPQYPQLGKALDRPLEVWLQEYTFPLEARYADPAFARYAYEVLVADLLANGTTTAVMYGTVHDEPNRILVDTCLASGLRSLIGKVAMDHPENCPDFYRDASVEAALAGTEDLIGYVQKHPGNRTGLIRPVITPRFIPSCTDATLEGLGALRQSCGCHVQTHCSESDWQHRYAYERFGRSDTESLDRFGLLSRHTVLAHAPLLSEADMILVRDRGSGIAHCPLSNVYFSNAAFPLRTALAKGLRVGLGTDISAGPSASMFSAARMSVAMSRALESGVDPALPPERRGRAQSRIDWRTAFFLATAGGADVIDLPIGRFAIGHFFDAIIVDTRVDGTLSVFDAIDSDEDVLAKILYGATQQNLSAVYVGGHSTLARRKEVAGA